MYAVIATGGKQYKVEAGQVLRLEKLAGEVGETVELAPVLMLGGEGEPTIGQPYVEGASIKATILEQGKAKKITVFKKKRRKGYQVKRGHRQHFTAVRINDISA
ncbi:MAG: 50S ribosomal protein L21 [Desulfarculaceae bacterium]|nr:50S ribosomal protein L21 [Desulfarculaceae bacterium]MCF8071875.1 50S ribosomal protein L21 [Desulfarculaceae bacterium]MCF8101425.1 50S ribosomal protein L21 [Desulfarculaceae bacterium]MCF8117416.1 50S ribosomal protein L21 [Desulfarculaceae bacterium]